MVHRTTTGARLVLWNPADGNPAEKLGISHGRSSKDGYHIYRVPPTILWSFPLRMQFPMEGLLSRTGGQPRPEELRRHSFRQQTTKPCAALKVVCHRLQVAEQCPLLEQDLRNDAVIARVMALPFRNRREGMRINANHPPPAHHAMYARHRPMDVP